MHISSACSRRGLPPYFFKNPVVTQYPSGAQRPQKTLPFSHSSSGAAVDEVVVGRLVGESVRRRAPGASKHQAKKIVLVVGGWPCFRLGYTQKSLWRSIRVYRGSGFNTQYTIRNTLIRAYSALPQDIMDGYPDRFIGLSVLIKSLTRI